MRLPEKGKPVSRKDRPRKTNIENQTEPRVSDSIAGSRENFLSVPSSQAQLVRSLPRLEGNSSDYRRLIHHRFLYGLLTPFLCASCRRWALDPVGRNSKHSFLCQSCTDTARGQRS
jgi:hypothetical protein